MHHILHLGYGIHAAAAYHNIGVHLHRGFDGQRVVLAGGAVVSKLGEIDVVALHVGEPIRINSARARMRMHWPSVGSKGKCLKIRSSTCRICIGS